MPAWSREWPPWSLPGAAVVFTAASGIVSRPLASSESSLLVPASEARRSYTQAQEFANDISERLGLLLYQRHSERTGWDLWTVPVDGHGEPTPFLQTESDEAQGKFSPNGLWIAYASDESGQREVYIRAFSQANRKLKASAAGGHLPRWSSDGSELFFVDLEGVINVIGVTHQDGSIVLGPPKLLFAVSEMYSTAENFEFASEYTYDLSRNGDRILAMRRPLDTPFPALRILLNWQVAGR